MKFMRSSMKNEVRRPRVPRLARILRPGPPAAGHPNAATSGMLSARAAQFGLTVREGQVMEHLAKGLLYKEIADRMNVSYAVVHKLQHKIFVKLQVTNRTEAVVKWYSLSRG
jgi:DNA-binding NarL/FixJ family response regulator